MRNTRRHDTASTSQPPRNGPIAVAAPVKPAQAPIAEPWSSERKLAVMSEAARHEHRPAHTLEGSRCDQCADAGCKAAQDGGGGEPDQAEHEQAPAAVLVAECAAQQEQRAGSASSRRASCRPESPPPRSSPMRGSATLTTVESRSAMPEPRMAAKITTAACRPELDELGGSGRTGRLRHEAAPRSRSSDSE